MNLTMGNQIFIDVAVPVLWGKRAILQDGEGRLSVIDLSGDKARIELLADEPAPGVGFRPQLGGVVILKDKVELYSYSRSERALSSINLDLPDIEIDKGGTRVGSSYFSGNSISGFGVGLAVSKDGVSFGAPLPSGLAKLVV